MKENDTTIQFHIPRNVITRFEIFPGIGWVQLFFVAIGFLFAIGFWLITAIILVPLVMRLFFSILIVGLPAFISIPNPSLGNISLLDKIMKAYKFQKTQKIYRMRKVD